MKKNNESAVLETEKKQPTLFKETYLHLYKDEKWPIEVTFTDEIVKAPAPQGQFEGMYYVEGHSGSSQAAYHFQGEVLNNYWNRNKLNEWIKTKIFKEAV